MQTATAGGWMGARSFALRAVAWSVGLFGVLRLDWVEAQGLLPLTQLQAWLGVGLCGIPARPVTATLACSGADVTALCVGAILAYPASWRMRLAGVSGGLALVFGLNTVRIGTLGRAAASPVWFEALHLYVWPAVLILAVAGYVFAWMRLAEGRDADNRRLSESVTRDSVPTVRAFRAHVAPPFMVLTATFLLLFTAAAPLYLQSAAVLSVAAFIAREAAAVLHVLGVAVRTTDNVLWTDRGGFEVTQECISTPLIPVYLAAVFAFGRTWPHRALGVLATAPLFVGLGIARLLVVALPATLVASPISIVHAFYQLLLAAVVVTAAAIWRHGVGRVAWLRALLGMAAGASVGLLLGEPYGHMLARAAETLGAGAPINDPQGALMLLPAFQVGLYLALWVAALVALGWARFWSGLALLGLTQAATMAVVPWLASQAGFVPHVRDVRAWAVAGPVFVAVAVEAFDGLRRRSTRLSNTRRGL